MRFIRVPHPASKVFRDLTGKRFGRFVVISYAGKASYTMGQWNCVCDCGTKKIVRTANLARPNVSCGCWRKENNRATKTTHGMRRTRPYRIWANMKNRCTNPKSNRAHIYFHRGITFPEKWKTFEGFWSDMKTGYMPHLTLERKNNDLGYSKENCVWDTYKAQANNRRNKKSSSK